MLQLVNGILVIICALMVSLSVIDKHIFTAFIYLVALVFFYMQLERGVFKDGK